MKARSLLFFSVGLVASTVAFSVAAESIYEQIWSGSSGCQIYAEGPNVIFDGCNVIIRNGEGETRSTNGRGNLIVGYNEEREGYYDPSPYMQGYDRGGSHNVIIGEGHLYPHFGGLAAGMDNTLIGFFSVAFGMYNAAVGDYATITGGSGNVAVGMCSSISGGAEGYTQGYTTSVTGGFSNFAFGDYSSVSGGYANDAFGSSVSVGAGFLEGEAEWLRQQALTDY